MTQSLNIALMILLAAPAGVSLAQDTASEAPIRAIVADQVVAWNAGNGQAYARHLAPDASFTDLFGMVLYDAPAFASALGKNRPFLLIKIDPHQEHDLPRGKKDGRAISSTPKACGVLSLDPRRRRVNWSA